MVENSIETDGGESSYFDVPDYSSVQSVAGSQSPVRYESDMSQEFQTPRSVGEGGKVPSTPDSNGGR
jgi:hypothetical protein